MYNKFKYNRYFQIRITLEGGGVMAKEKLHCKVTLCLLGDKRAFGPGVA